MFSCFSWKCLLRVNVFLRWEGLPRNARNNIGCGEECGVSIHNVKQLSAPILNDDCAKYPRGAIGRTSIIIHKDIFGYRRQGYSQQGYSEQFSAKTLLRAGENELLLLLKQRAVPGKNTNFLVNPLMGLGSAMQHYFVSFTYCLKSVQQPSLTINTTV